MNKNMFKNSKHEFRNPKQIRNSNVQNSKRSKPIRCEVVRVIGNDLYCFGHLYFGHSNLFRISIFEFRIYLNKEEVQNAWRK
jgi:hypothetical protein